jgi:hypothetical protein
MSKLNLRDLSASGELLIDLGLQPVSNRFLPLNALSEAPSFPFALRLRSDIGLIHIGQPFPADELKPRYNWLTCFEPEDHLDDLVSRIIDLPGISKASVFGAYSFKDDSTLRRLENLGYSKTWRLDTDKDLGITDSCSGVETIQSVLTVEKAKEISEKKGLADVMIVRHVIEHSNDLLGFMKAIRTLTNPEGYIIWELPDCERALKAGDCTTIWEEHTFYFTMFTFRQLMEDAGFEMIHYESVPYQFENSLLAIVKAKKNVVIPTPVNEEDRLHQINLAHQFAHAVTARRDSVREKLLYLKKKYGAIALFGAGHLSVAFLSIMGVSDLIDFVIDDNPHKKDMLMPKGGLKILDSEALYSRNIKVCLLSLNPQNQPNVIEKHKKFTENGGVFASIFPGSKLDINTTL